MSREGAKRRMAIERAAARSMNAARSNSQFVFVSIGSAAGISESSPNRLFSSTDSARETATGSGAYGPISDRTDSHHAYRNKARRAGANAAAPRFTCDELGPGTSHRPPGLFFGWAQRGRRSASGPSNVLCADLEKSKATTHPMVRALLTARPGGNASLSVECRVDHRDCVDGDCRCNEGVLDSRTAGFIFEESYQ